MVYGSTQGVTSHMGRFLVAKVRYVGNKEVGVGEYQLGPVETRVVAKLRERLRMFQDGLHTVDHTSYAGCWLRSSHFP